MATDEKVPSPIHISSLEELREGDTLLFNGYYFKFVETFIPHYSDSPIALWHHYFYTDGRGLTAQRHTLETLAKQAERGFLCRNGVPIVFDAPKQDAFKDLTTEQYEAVDPGQDYSEVPGQTPDA